MADAAGDYETVDSDRDPGENTDSDDDGIDEDNDDDDGDDDDDDDSAVDVDDGAAGVGGEGGGDKDKDDDDDDDDDIRPGAADSSDDADYTNFSNAHQPLQGSFKTAEGITITIVKGSIAAQKVLYYYYIILLLFTIMAGDEVGKCCIHTGRLTQSAGCAFSLTLTMH